MFQLLRRVTKINFQAPNLRGLIDDAGDAIMDPNQINAMLAEHYSNVMGPDDWS